MYSLKRYLTIILLFALKFTIVEILVSQTRYPGELNIEVEGIGGSEGWTVTYEALSYPRWFDDNGKKYITNSYEYGLVSGIGNNPARQGFDSPDNLGPGVPIAYGYYLFTYEFDEHGNKPTIKLDLYDANWSTQGYPGSHDLYIKWNNNESKFYYNNDVTGGYVYLLLGY